MSLQLDPDDQEFRAAMALRRRHVPEEQMRQFEGYVAAIFTAFGLDLHTPATEDTPRRFLHALLDSTEGYEGDAKLFTAFAPQIAGRDGATERPGLVAGKSLAPEHPRWGTLTGVKRGGNHLFLRYAFTSAA